jgi:hypothetical protein
MSSFGLLVTFVAVAVGTASILIAVMNMVSEYRLDKDWDRRVAEDLQESLQATPKDDDEVSAAHNLVDNHGRPLTVESMTVESYISAGAEKQRAVDKYLQSRKKDR